MKKLVLFVTVVIFSLSMFSGCENKAEEGFHIEGQGYSLAFEELKKDVNMRRKSIIEKSEPIDITKYTPDFKDELDMFSQDEIENLVTFKVLKDVSKEDAIEDVDTLIKMLKHSYGAYEYFGGDEVFNKAKEDIVKQINLSIGKDISNKNFQKILFDNLKFIKDGHFRIGNEGLCDYQNMYICDDFIFTYEDGKYYTTYKGDKLQVVSINNDKNIENYIKPSISETGEICYGLISLFNSKDDADTSNKMKVKYKIITKDIDINWNLAKNSPMIYGFVYGKDIIDDINIYSIKRMLGDEKQLNDFSQSALEAKKEKIFIIDLRGNSGGYDESSCNWFLNYNGTYPNVQGSVGQKFSKLSISHMKQVNPNIEEYISDEEMLLANNGKWNTYLNNGVWVENKNIILVLIDKNVASSGETMIENLRTMDNVIFIGSNSAGCSLVPNNSYKYLPNSGISMFYGQGISLIDDGKNRDGIGYLPDIWVNPDDALDLALKMCKYYNLNTSLAE